MSLLLSNKKRRFVASGGTDPYENDVVLYLKGDDTNGSTNIIDSSPSPKTITVNGNTQISTAQSKYGGSSIYFDGSGDYLSLNNSVDFDFDSAFTIEWWQYLTGTTLYFPTLFSMRTGNTVANNKISPSYGDVGYNYKLNWVVPGGESNFTSTLTQSSHNGQWVHGAISRDNATTRCYINGVLDYSIADTVAISGCFLDIGRNVNQYGTFYFTGYIDSLRITKGIARYTSNFNPETDTYLAY